MGRRTLLRLDASTVDSLLGALHASEPVSGLTHTYYKYPARFSPHFASTVIRALTEPGDVVLDPFMGGGTTLVEALANGRTAIGCDINPLAGFLAAVKTTPLSPVEIAAIRSWRRRYERALDLHKRLPGLNEWAGYDLHVPWWLRKTIHSGLLSLAGLETDRLKSFARCTLARTAQWALDSKRDVPTAREFLAKHEEHVSNMIAGGETFRAQLEANYGPNWRSSLRTRRRILVRNAAGLESDRYYPKEWQRPRLILTSPPYLGVHILYHRWQVQGRRETAAPYWIAGRHNGFGASHFTFGDRKGGAEKYLPSMRRTFRSIHALMSGETVLVQLVAFADPNKHLPKYLNVLEELGFEQADQLGTCAIREPRERRVPNRKWYADPRDHSGASREFLLIHYRKQ